MSRYAQRRDRLRKLIRKEADAILVTNFVNVTYLTGFTGDDSYLLLTRDGAVVLSDPRYTEQLQDECPGLDLEIRRPGTTILDTIAKVGRKAKLGKLAIEADSMTLALHEKIAVGLPKTELVPTSGLVEQLREIKDKGEVDEIRRAIDYAERAFGVVKASLRPEQTELEIAHQLENQIRLFGGTGCSFKPIVAVGPRAALPHATPTKQKVSEGDILLIDWGAFAGLYLSDLTRVLVTGRISPKLERIYGVVLKAQLAAIAKIKPGVLMSDVDAAARDLIGKAGYGKQFGHGLGHGIGQEIHESPRFAANWKRPLKAGMVVTVEPGIYFPNWGGVRIEDDVLVTRTGCEVLSSVPKEFADNVLN